MLQFRFTGDGTLVWQLQSRSDGFWVVYLMRKEQSRQLPYMSYDLYLSNTKVTMAKGSPLETNNSPSQHQNPVGKLGMGFKNEVKEVRCLTCVHGP